MRRLALLLLTLWRCSAALREQMTYPDVSASKDLSLEQLSEILKTVDLGYLLEREDVLTKEVNWDEELSLGEKQRLAIARLVHHRPKFAVLDVSLLRVQSSCLRLWSPDGQVVFLSVGVHSAQP